MSFFKHFHNRTEMRSLVEWRNQAVDMDRAARQTDMAGLVFPIHALARVPGDFTVSPDVQRAIDNQSGNISSGVPQFNIW